MQALVKSRAGTFLILWPILLGLMGCGAQMRNLPVGAGRMQINASAGGPLIEVFSTTLPIPYALGGVTYGLSDHWEAYADAHVLAAAYKFLGATAGVVYFPAPITSRWVPSIGADGMLFSDFSETALFPELTTTLARRVGSRCAPYAGMRHTFQTTRGPAYIPSPFAGVSYRLGRVQIVGEVQWLAAGQDNRWNPVDYHGIDNHGAVATQLGLTYDLPGGRHP